MVVLLFLMIAAGFAPVEERPGTIRLRSWQAAERYAGNARPRAPYQANTRED